MGSLSPIHWLMVLLIVALLFGGSRLGELGKSLGEGIRNFKKGVGGDDEDEAAKKQIPEKGSESKTDSSSPS